MDLREIRPETSANQLPSKVILQILLQKNTWDVTVKTDFQNTVVSLAPSLGPTGPKLKKKKEKKNEPKT